MATAAELRSLADKTSFDIPTIDFQVGIPGNQGALKSGRIGADLPPGVTYDANTKVVHIKQDNINLTGYNFSGVTVSVEANNVTIQNSKFDASYGYYSVIQTKGKSGLVLDHNSFDGLKLNNNFSDFINGGDGKVTVTYNSFVNAPSDAIQLKAGLIDHNYFSGSGYHAGAHADAITIDGTTGEVVITNNLIDTRKPADALVAATSAIAIGNYYGNNHDITVSGNIILGGAYSVYVHDFGKYSYSKIDVVGNLVGGGLYGDLYPKNQPAALVFENTTIAPKSGVLSVAQEAFPGTIVTGKQGQIGEVLQGGDGSDHIYGHGDGDVLIGGGGRDFMFGGAGADTFKFNRVSDSSGQTPDVISGFQDGIDKLDFSAIGNAGSGLRFLGAGAFDGQAGAVHTVSSVKSTWVEIDTNGDRAADLRVELTGNHALKASDFLLGSQVAAQATVSQAKLQTAAVQVPLSTGVTVKGTVGHVGEVLQGGDGSDYLYGHGNQDVLIGGNGRDFMFGGAGTDIFKFRSASESTLKASDVIGGFQDGIDKIDIRSLATANAALLFKGQAAFSGGAGEVHVVNAASSSFAEVDLNGDRIADFRVELQGVHHLVAADFVL